MESRSSPLIKGPSTAKSSKCQISANYCKQDFQSYPLISSAFWGNFLFDNNRNILSQVFFRCKIFGIVQLDVLQNYSGNILVAPNSFQTLINCLFIYFIKETFTNDQKSDKQKIIISKRKLLPLPQENPFELMQKRMGILAARDSVRIFCEPSE